MKNALLKIAALAALAGGCQPSDHVDPDDDRTGNPPPPASAVYAFNPARSPRFLTANLTATSGVSAEFEVADGALRPIRENGVYPASAGADANLVASVGFGTYVNPDVRGPGVPWGEANPFRSVLNATITLQQPGDAVRFCRSFATTCVEVMADPSQPGVNLAILTLAANVPNTEIGEIADGISAAIRGTGSAGLTIALADPTVLVRPFESNAGTPFDITWSIARGDIEGSLDYSLAINGAEVASGNTTSALGQSIVTDGGVALMFDMPVATTTSYEVDYSYSFAGTEGDFSNNFGVGVDLSPQSGLIPAPLYVYPTAQPGYELLTLSGAAGTPHAVQAEDAILGAVGDTRPGQKPQAVVLSTSFNGDDFAGTPLEGFVDQGGTGGGGFYPSPALCYSQIMPTLRGTVEDGVKQEVHRTMYARVANGVLAADASLQALSAALQGAPFNLPADQVGYTRVGNLGNGDIDGYIVIGTDYADNNVEANIATSVLETYTATLTDEISTRFVAELNGIIGALEANNNQILTALIQAGAITQPQFVSLKTLQAALTTPPGSRDGVVGANGQPQVDDGATRCAGYACNVEAVVRDLVNGTNLTSRNPNPGVPGLAAACLFGVPGSAEVPAQEATLTGNVATDHPAYDAVPAEEPIAPAREIAAASINELVIGIYSNFVSQAFGPIVPASNFSVRMFVGDTASGLAPSVSSIVITRE